MRAKWMLGVALLLAGCNGGTDASKGAAAGGAAAAGAQEDIGEVLAVVNGMEIGSKEFQEAAARRQPASGDTLSLEEKQEVLDRLVDEKLLYQKALAIGLDKDPKVQKVIVNTLLRKEVYATVRNSDFTDEELKAYFDQHKDEFVIPEKVQIKRILIKVGDRRTEEEARAEAERIYRELKKDPSKFKELASKHSEDPYRRRGGDVGFVPRSGKPGLDPEVVDKAFSMKVGELSEPFKTAEGYNIILVANRRERVERTFQQMKGSVLRKLKNERLKEKYEEYVARLRKDAKIQVNQDKLEALEVKSARRAFGPGFQLAPALNVGSANGDKGGDEK